MTEQTVDAQVGGLLEAATDKSIRRLASTICGAEGAAPPPAAKDDDRG